MTGKGAAGVAFIAFSTIAGTLAVLWWTPLPAGQRWIAATLTGPACALTALALIDAGSALRARRQARHRRHARHGGRYRTRH